MLFPRTRRIIPSQTPTKMAIGPRPKGASFAKRLRRDHDRGRGCLIDVMARYRRDCSTRSAAPDTRKTAQLLR
jgi:hypothetical protein